MGLKRKYLLIAVALTALDLWVAFRYGTAIWQAYSDFLPVGLLLLLLVAVWITGLADLCSRVMYRARRASRPRRGLLSEVAASTGASTEASDV